MTWILLIELATNENAGGQKKLEHSKFPYYYIFIKI
jgi:hypothetical protein